MRQVFEKLEFIAFFDTQEDAEAAASEVAADCQVCWLFFKDSMSFQPGKNETGNPLS